jgi:tetratricopeptide (TPR) repeat protein
MMLAEEAAFVRAQRQELSRRRVRDYIVTMLAGFALLLIASSVWSAATSRAVVVEAFDTPPALVERGLTPQVMAGMMQDAIGVIQAANVEAAKNRSVDNAWTNDIKVQVPNAGVSIGDIDRLLRARFGSETHISGSVVRNLDKTISLAVRATGVPPKTFTGPEASLPQLVSQAADYVYGRFEPALFAQFLLTNRTPAETIAFVDEALPRAAPEDRGDLSARAATALSLKGDTHRALRKYREAITFDPYTWRAWANYVGEVYVGLGEERGVAVGRQLLRRIAEAPADRKPANNDLSVLQNYQPLVQDWTGLLQDTNASRDAAGGRNLLVSGSALVGNAITETYRHDEAVAMRTLAVAEPSQERAAAALLIQGWSRLDHGDAAGAIAPLERFNAMWAASENLRYTYEGQPCYLGQAYGIVGRLAEAQAVFDKIGKWMACYTAAADVSAAHDDGRTVDRAFARAVALAPSMPLAYQHWGLALANRGDFPRAEAMFHKANETGPNWADPLKSLGDMAVRRSDWQAAVSLYDRAAPLAPGWPELAQARRSARAKLDALHWWNRW